jgi:hypothetical protein
VLEDNEIKLYSLTVWGFSEKFPEIENSRLCRIPGTYCVPGMKKMVYT